MIIPFWLPLHTCGLIRSDVPSGSAPPPVIPSLSLHYGHTEVAVFFFSFSPLSPSLPLYRSLVRGNEQNHLLAVFLDFLLLRWLTTRYVTLDALECLK